jgi:hypothetical protein
MNDLPPLAWILLCAVVVIIIVMNLALVALVRYRNNLKFPAMPSRPQQSQPRMDTIVNILRDPFAGERRQLDELSGLVQDLDENKKPDSST